MARKQLIIPRLIVKIISITVVLFLIIFSFKLLQQSLQSGLTENINLFITQQNFDTAPKAFLVSYMMSILVLAGSPVAALGVSLNTTGLIKETLLPFIIYGSRLAPVLILIIPGLLHLFSRRSLIRSLKLIVVTYITGIILYLPTILIFPIIFSQRNIEIIPLNIFSTSRIDSIIERIYPLMPPLYLFIFSLILLLISFILFDKVFSLKEFIPLEGKNIRHKWHISSLKAIAKPFTYTYQLFNPSFPMTFSRWIQTPNIAFIIGFAIALITTSMSVALVLLLPFYNKRILSTAAAISYIIGGNIATLADTYVVSLVLESPSSANIIITIILALLISSIAFLLFNQILIYLIRKISKAAIQTVQGVVTSILIAIAAPIILFFLI